MADEEDRTKSGKIFAGVRFGVIPSESLDEGFSVKIIRTLEDNGAEYVSSNKHGRLNEISLYTHIIATTSDFPDYDNAADSLIPVVTPTWIEHSLQKQKRSNTRNFTPDPSLFFSDVVLHCADIPEGDKEAITGGVLAMGGTYSANLSGAVTHIVALTEDNSECERAKDKNLPCMVVLPHWFDDCLKLGKKIDERPYTFPDPEILNPKYSGPVLKHKENQDAFVPSRTTDSEGLPEGVFPASQPSPSCRALNIFSGQNVKLSQDLDIGGRLRGTLEGLIRSAGGNVTNNISSADTCVCQYRDGPDYIHASQAGKSVGSLLWLYHMLKKNTWTNPMRRLLHYPVPRNGMDCFRDCRISISNYTGDARTYLQSLIEASGARFTRNMSQNNTHLLTAHTLSEKCEAAREWNVNVVNHLWLEESYAKCQVQTLSNPRYTHFPKRTNLGEVVGKTGIDREVLMNRHSNKESGKSPPKAKANAIRQMQKPSPKKQRQSSEQEQRSHGSTPAELANGGDEHSTPLTDKEHRARNMTLPTRTPATNKEAAGKENETPRTTGKRGAKERAVNKMHDLAPDIALYEKEVKRKGGVTHGGRRIDEDDGAKKGKEINAGRKRGRVESEEDDEDEEEKDAPTKSKAKGKTKRAKRSLPPIDHRMLLTGANEYVADDKMEAALKDRLRYMGIVPTSNPAEATILCAPKVMRTRKFVAALAVGPLVVHTSFLDHCLAYDEPPPAADHDLGNDPDTEQRFGLQISEVINRAKMNQRRLLRGWNIFCTEAVNGGFDTYKDIVSLNGGQCLLWKGRASVNVTKRKPLPDAGEESQNQGGEEEEDVLYLISGTSKDEKALWDKFRALAEKHDMRPRIVKPDWLLSCAMAQQVEWKEEYELKRS
ncbi:MAG: hypothetical protein Q9165_003472 [Trypethelium subeluteriae]